MDEAIAADVVERLRTRRIFAHVNRRAGVYNVGVRVVMAPDGAVVLDVAAADYDAPPPARPSTRSPDAAPRPLTPAQQRQQTWRDRLRKRR